MKHESTRTITAYRQALRKWMGFRSPRLIVVFVVVVALLRTALGAPHPGDLLAVMAGVIIWPFLEWGLHRYLLHIRPFRFLGVTVDPEFSRSHRAHHAEPWRPELIVLPPYIHLTLGPLLIAGAWWLAPSPALALSALAGFGLAALNYEWTHFLVHTHIRPKNAYYRGLFRNHRLHHFRNEKYWYGFTVTSVDRLLGTGPDPDSTPRSPDCRDLGVKS
ncbi:sterol desaturase family protein [Marinobacter sp.]|uniref:sterol desaturase family protein n=1 Tax=Marinobacter sp. TaxID=50741 RepID=UPI00384CA944